MMTRQYQDEEIRFLAKKIKGRGGFTLIEVLVASAVLIVILSSLYVALKSASDVWSRGGTRMEAYQQARIILEMMTRDIRSARKYGGGVVCFEYSDNDSADSIGFIAASEADHNYGVEEISYYLSNNVLYRENVSGQPNGVWSYSGSESFELAAEIQGIDLEWSDDGEIWSTASRTWTNDLPRTISIVVTTKAKGKEKAKTFKQIVFIPASIN